MNQIQIFLKEISRMAGRPRMMAKRVGLILDQHRALVEELRHLGRHHMPAAGQRWDLELPCDSDPVPALWRRAVFEAGRVSESIEDLFDFLELKVKQLQATVAASEDADMCELDDAGDITTGAGETVVS